MTALSRATDILRTHIRDVADFPKPGVMFKDINPLLADPRAFGTVVQALAEQAHETGVNKIAGIEARGFFFAAPVALEVCVGVLPIRKAGKLPGKTLSETYALEYGSATVEIQEGAVSPGDRVLVIDDVLATGGTAAATARLIEALGGDIVGIGLLIEIVGLGGRAAFADRRLEVLASY
jgi:adenine phosphoribosyltransferase